MLIELGLHNLGDLGVALENLDMALDINPNLDDKDALHMKTLLTQLLRQYGYMKREIPVIGPLNRGNSQDYVYQL